jgi:predicted transcriptional regulator
MRIPKPESTLTRQELAIMKLIWQLETATVRDVYEALRRRRRVAYTTVMTMMKILTEKGYLTKRLEGRAYRYRPAHPKQAVVGSMVREFVARVFDGASRPLLLHLVRQGRLTDADRAELARLIKETK